MNRRVSTTVITWMFCLPGLWAHYYAQTDTQKPGEVEVKTFAFREGQAHAPRVLK